MREAIKEKLKTENEAIKSTAINQVDTTKSWLEKNKAVLVQRLLLTGLILLIFSSGLRGMIKVIPKMGQSLNALVGMDVAGAIYQTGWNVTSLAVILILVVYVLPVVIAVLKAIWRPIRYTLLIFVSIIFWVMELLGVGAAFIRWVRGFIPALRKGRCLKADEEPKQKGADFEALKNKRKRAKAAKEETIVPRTVQLIENGPVLYFEKTQKSGENKKRIAENIKDDFLFACSKYDMDYVAVMKVTKGPSATILGCSIGSASISDIKKKEADIAREMKVDWIKIENGRGLVNIVVPCKGDEREYVPFEDVISDFKPVKGAPLCIPIGKIDTGEILTVNLPKGPHIGIAGATGSGKSTTLQEIICSLLMMHGPETLRFVMIDTKIVELSVYKDIPHLLKPIITEPDKAVVALMEVDRISRARYKQFEAAGCKDIDGYNKKASSPLPFIVVIIEELGDLMMNKHLKEGTESAIVKIVQYARAAGICIIFATQRPSVEVVTGLIKSNVPGRLVFAVSSSVDSNVAMGESGAEKLLGEGDGLLKMSGLGRPVHFQGAFIKDEDIERIADHWRKYDFKKPNEEQKNKAGQDPVDVSSGASSQDKAGRESTKTQAQYKPSQHKQDFNKVPDGILKAAASARYKKSAKTQETLEVHSPEDHTKEPLEEMERPQTISASVYECDQDADPSKKYKEDEEQVDTEALKSEFFEKPSGENSKSESKDTVYTLLDDAEYDAEQNHDEILTLYESLDENTRRVGLYVAMIRWRNRYTDVPVLPSTRDINSSIKIKKEVLLEALSILDEEKIICKSEAKGRYATTTILISYDDSVKILEHYRPDILKA